MKTSIIAILALTLTLLLTTNAREIGDHTFTNNGEDTDTLNLAISFKEENDFIADYSFNFTSNKLLLRLTTTDTNLSYGYTIVYDYSDGKSYTVDNSTGACWVEDIEQINIATIVNNYLLSFIYKADAGKRLTVNVGQLGDETHVLYLRTLDNGSDIPVSLQINRPSKIGGTGLFLDVVTTNFDLPDSALHLSECDSTRRLSGGEGAPKISSKSISFWAHPPQISN
mmetsp:Transcript_9889/g.11187  ORF Transcript_9889/g.11187 Transcript_9889/m.11187 type:complete len:226 (+) Transcript_9889:16-693(+)